MKLNEGITTEKITEGKEFYTKVLNFGVTFENEFYLLLYTPDKSTNLAFLLPNHPSQHTTNNIKQLVYSGLQGFCCYASVFVGIQYVIRKPYYFILLSAFLK